MVSTGSNKTNLTSRRTNAGDSLTTLEIFGSLIIDTITGTNTGVLNNRFYRNIHFKAWAIVSNNKNTRNQYPSGPCLSFIKFGNNAWH